MRTALALDELGILRDGSPSSAVPDVSVNGKRCSQLEIVRNLRLQAVQEIKHIAGANGIQEHRDRVAVGDIAPEVPRRVDAPRVDFAVRQVAGEPDKTVGQQQIEVSGHVGAGLDRIPDLGLQPKQIAQVIILGVEPVVFDGVDGLNELVPGFRIDPQRVVVIRSVKLRQDRNRGDRHPSDMPSIGGIKVFYVIPGPRRRQRILGCRRPGDPESDQQQQGRCTQAKAARYRSAGETAAPAQLEATESAGPAVSGRIESPLERMHVHQPFAAIPMLRPNAPASSEAKTRGNDRSCTRVRWRHPCLGS